MASPIMHYFDHRHLKDGPLRDISKEYTEFAEKLEKFLPAGAEKSEALRDLLKSKDSAVRAALDLTTEDQRAPQTEDQPKNGIESITTRGEQVVIKRSETPDEKAERLIREKGHFPGDSEMDQHPSSRDGKIHLVMDEQVFGPNGDAALRAIAERAQRRMRDSY